MGESICIIFMSSRQVHNVTEILKLYKGNLNKIGLNYKIKFKNISLDLKTTNLNIFMALFFNKFLLLVS